ncbi:putative G-protein coupled receptor No18 [Folsomia candida]|uniref:Putative G-protein coupled receptor No18 n=1 Tax=Folsomia candida TaxID=158441 RepID=A0A226E9T9_FOLCA|nr:putative G-protein coupled receptor No18 [Folsomia candida]
MNVSIALSGSYICEVVTDAPRFLTERATTEIQILSETNRTISHKNGTDLQNPPLSIRSTLWSNLFGDYNKNLYPDGGAVILLGMSLIDVDINPEGFMDANVWAKLSWTDNRLKWDIDLTPVEFMTVAEENVWKPEIFLLNGPKPSGDCSKLGSVLVTPDGNVSWTSSCVYRTFCVWNYALDPCEEQSCGIEFEAWSKSGVIDKGFDLKRYVQRKYNVTRNFARKTVLETGNDNSIQFGKSVTFSMELRKNVPIRQIFKLFNGNFGNKLFLTCACLSAIAAIVGNGLVLLAWIFYKPVRKPQNSYLLSLAVVDLLVGVILCPTMIGELGWHPWRWGREWCQIYLLADWLLTTSSVLHLVAISMDRYHVIFDTATYTRRRTFPFFLRRICFLWTVTFWLITPPMRDWGGMGERSVQLGMCLSNMSTELSVHFAFGSFVLPVALLVGLRSLGGWKAAAEVREIAEYWEQSESEGGLYAEGISVIIIGKTVEDEVSKFKRSRRAAKMLGLIIGAYILTWLPFTVEYAISGFIPEGNRPDPLISAATVAICYSNSAFNPAIYAYCNPDFRKGFIKLVMFWKKRKN